MLEGAPKANQMTIAIFHLSWFKDANYLGEKCAGHGILKHLPPLPTKRSPSHFSMKLEQKDLALWLYHEFPICKQQQNLICCQLWPTGISHVLGSSLERPKCSITISRTSWLTGLLSQHLSGFTVYFPQSGYILHWNRQLYVKLASRESVTKWFRIKVLTPSLDL